MKASVASNKQAMKQKSWKYKQAQRGARNFKRNEQTKEMFTTSRACLQEALDSREVVGAASQAARGSASLLRRL